MKKTILLFAVMAGCTWQPLMAETSPNGRAYEVKDGALYFAKVYRAEE